MIVLVSPRSTGTELARAFRAAGEECIHLWNSLDEDFFREDPNARKILHRSLSETLEELRRMNATAVVAASEYGVELADAVAPELGVAGHLPEYAAARRDKLLQMRRLEACGLPAARSTTVRTTAELSAALDTWSAFPVMIKPRDGVGGDGCRRCETREEAEFAFNQIVNQRNIMGKANDEVLLQDFLEGRQYIVNTVSARGRHLLSDIYACRIDNHPDGTPFYRHALSRMTLSAADQEVVEYVYGCLDAIGVREGAAHVELRLTANGPRLIEVNSRVMGPCLAPDPYVLAFGYSQQHLAVESQLWPEKFIDRMRRPYAPKQHVAEVFLRCDRDGEIIGIPGTERIKDLPGFHSLEKMPEVGQPTRQRFLALGAMGIAFFVHHDEAVIADSLARLHDLEDAGEFFTIRADQS